MVTLDDLTEEDLKNVALAFQMTYCKQIIPYEFMCNMSKDALRYYVDEMEKIRDGGKA